MKRAKDTRCMERTPGASSSLCFRAQNWQISVHGERYVNRLRTTQRRFAVPFTQTHVWFANHSARSCIRGFKALLTFRGSLGRTTGGNLQDGCTTGGNLLFLTKLMNPEESFAGADVKDSSSGSTRTPQWCDPENSSGGATWRIPSVVRPRELLRWCNLEDSSSGSTRGFLRWCDPENSSGGTTRRTRSVVRPREFLHGVSKSQK